ncbi:MAG: phage scaffolding protein [Dialister pneumosintes]
MRCSSRKSSVFERRIYMTREELKALGLSDEQIEKIVDDYGKNYVSKGQFNQKNEESKTLKGELDNYKNEIDKLKKDNKDNQSLVEQIDALKNQATEREKTYKAQAKQMQVNNLVELSLIKNKAKNTTAAKALLKDLDKAEIVDGDIKGLSEQIEALKKSDAYLFDAVKIGHAPGEGGTTPPNQSVQEQLEKAMGI